MSGKHTPGPWAVFFEAGDIRPGIEAGDVSIVVYRSDDPSDQCGVDGKSPEEALANATLIAAAPEMRDALYLAAATLKLMGADDCDALAAIRDVLAKAEGTLPTPQITSIEKG